MSYEMTEDRTLVMDTMHYNGKLSKKITDEQWGELYLMCDGFGMIGLGFAQMVEWDWSHVRDSNTEALATVAKEIRKIFSK